MILLFPEKIDVILKKRIASSCFVAIVVVIFLLLMLSGCGQASQAADVSSPTFTAVPWPSATSVPPTATEIAIVTPILTEDLTPVSPVSPVSTPTSSPTPQIDLENLTAINYTYKVINVFPHDHRSFIQGLIYVDGELLEGSGLYGESSLRRVDLETGEIKQFLELPQQFFGEGITVWGDDIIQLTWKESTGFVYDKDTFELKRQFVYPTEGWGITHDGEKLIMSDGTANLYFWDPETYTQIDRIEVHDANGPVIRLNELEYINGEVYANVWQTYRIVRIDPETGWVVGSIDLHGVITGEPIDVLNGIAYDAENDRLFVTGKLWPKLFEIELVEVE